MADRAMQEQMTNRIQRDNEGLIAFIADSPCAYQAVEQVSERLEKIGYHRQAENESWQAGKDRGYVVRNGSSLIAYQTPKSAHFKGFRIVCAHTDSPSFKVKENPEQTDANGYIKINVEKYGGMILNTWLDRSLSVAGRIVCAQEGRLAVHNVDLKSPALIIPNLAIHMTRGSDEKGFSVQTDMQPIAGAQQLYKRLAKAAGVQSPADILGADLFLYNTQPGCLICADTAEHALVCAPRLDDLQCVYAAMTGFLGADASLLPAEDGYIRVLALFDNEEVGSLTRQGAASDFLEMTLHNIADMLEMTASDYRHMLAESFMISADNAHAVHPNHAERADITNRPHLNAGIVIKYHGGQKYTTDAWTGAYVKQICRKNDIPYQTYQNHSDVAGGSTLGNIALGNVSIPAADIGAAQLAMHSAYETAGAADTVHMIDFMQAFWEA